MPGMELLIKIQSHNNGKEKGALISEFFFSWKPWENLVESVFCEI